MPVKLFKTIRMKVTQLCQSNTYFELLNVVLTKRTEKFRNKYNEYYYTATIYTGCGKIKYPLKFFAVFSATVPNFNLKFYRFIFGNVLHLTAKSNLILLKNDEVIDFLT